MPGLPQPSSPSAGSSARPLRAGHRPASAAEAGPRPPAPRYVFFVPHAAGAATAPGTPVSASCRLRRVRGAIILAEEVDRARRRSRLCAVDVPPCGPAPSVTIVHDSRAQRGVAPGLIQIQRPPRTCAFGLSLDRCGRTFRLSYLPRPAAGLRGPARVAAGQLRHQLFDQQRSFLPPSHLPPCP